MNEITPPQFEIGSLVQAESGETGELIGYFIYEGEWFYRVDPKGNFREIDLLELPAEEIKLIKKPSRKYQPKYEIGQERQKAMICGISRCEDEFLYYVGWPDFMVDSIHWHVLD